MPIENLNTKFYTLESLPPGVEVPRRLLRLLVDGVAANKCICLVVPGISEEGVKQILELLYNNDYHNVRGVCSELGRDVPDVVFVPTTNAGYEGRIGNDRDTRQRLRIRSGADYKEQLNEFNVWFNPDTIVPELSSSDQTGFVTMAKYGSGLYVFDHDIKFDSQCPTMQRVLGGECYGNHRLPSTEWY